MSLAVDDRTFACRGCGGEAVYSTKLCRPCNAAHQRDWRARQSPEWHEDQRRRWREQEAAKRAERRQIIDAAKTKPCADCGVSYPPCVMQFDHVRGIKEFNISAYNGYQWRRDKLEAEIAKCEVVCANCHMVRTHNRRTGGC